MAVGDATDAGPARPASVCSGNDTSMIQIDDILAELGRDNDAAGLAKVRKAFAFATRLHHGKLRLSGEEYISHPVEVARILVRLHLDADTVATGLLHDTLEDTPTTIDELRAEFGDEVAEMVDGVSKLSRITFRTSEQRQAESF